MSTILSLETSTTVCSVALHREGKLLGELSLYTEKSHSGQLGPLTDHLLRSCETDRRQLDAVAVSGGPGSYTGLRIGCSLAKGLCYALDIPLIAVSTLEAMARQVLPFVGTDDLLCPMIDARRMEVYTMVLNRQGSIVKDVHPLVLEDGAFNDLLDGNRIWFFGNGSEKAGEVITHKNALFAEGITTQARTVGEIATVKYGREVFEDLAYYEPFYLKEFQATKPKKRL